MSTQTEERTKTILMPISTEWYTMPMPPLFSESFLLMVEFHAEVMMRRLLKDNPQAEKLFGELLMLKEHLYNLLKNEGQSDNMTNESMYVNLGALSHSMEWTADYLLELE